MVKTVYVLGCIAIVLVILLFAGLFSQNVVIFLIGMIGGIITCSIALVLINKLKQKGQWY